MTAIITRWRHARYRRAMLLSQERKCLPKGIDLAHPVLGAPCLEVPPLSLGHAQVDVAELPVGIWSIGWAHGLSFVARSIDACMHESKPENAVSTPARFLPIMDRSFILMCQAFSEKDGVMTYGLPFLVSVVAVSALAVFGGGRVQAADGMSRLQILAAVNEQLIDRGWRAEVVDILNRLIREEGEERLIMQDFTATVRTDLARFLPARTIDGFLFVSEAVPAGGTLQIQGSAYAFIAPDMREHEVSLPNLRMQLGDSLPVEALARGGTTLVIEGSEEGNAALAEIERRRAESGVLDEVERLAALRAEDQRRLSVLSRQVDALRMQVSQLQELLGVSRLAEAEARTRIDMLSTELNDALARLAMEQRARADLEEAAQRHLEEAQR